MSHYSRDPYWITVRRAGRCQKCGEEIRPGERGFWYPATRSLLCRECGDGAARQFACDCEDEAVYAGGAA